MEEESKIEAKLRAILAICKGIGDHDEEEGNGGRKVRSNGYVNKMTKA